MEASVLETVGKVAGIGGIALGVLLLFFREVVRKNIFPKLSPKDAYRLLTTMTVAVFAVALAGVAPGFGLHPLWTGRCHRGRARRWSRRRHQRSGRGCWWEHQGRA